MSGRHWQIFSETPDQGNNNNLHLFEQLLCAGQCSKHFNLKQPHCVALVIILLLQIRRHREVKYLAAGTVLGPNPTVWLASPWLVGVGGLQTTVSPCRTGLSQVACLVDPGPGMEPQPPDP